LTAKENYLRNARFEGPEYIPCRIGLSTALRRNLRSELEEIIDRHPLMFPQFRKKQKSFYMVSPREAVGDFEDVWGCTWKNEIEGILGTVVGHPISNWQAFSTYHSPDPLKCEHMELCDWGMVREELRSKREAGELTVGHMGHGFLFMRLAYLRGFESLMLDIVSEEPLLERLIDMVFDFNAQILKNFIEENVDVVLFGEDLGAQKSSILGPHHFERWIAPRYTELFTMCREAGSLVALHTDGYIMDIADQLIDTGVDIINPQDLCNGIENIKKSFKDRVCIRLDIDRQKIVPFGTPQEIRALIEEEVRVLGSQKGGLELNCGLYPPTPPENVEAVVSAMEDFRTYWWS